MQRLAIAALIATASIAASGAPVDDHDDGTSDSLLVKMMTAQIHALGEYARCLEDPGIAAPCEPPRPLQLPPQEPAQDHRAHGESIDSTARMLKDAEIHAIKAHAKCVRTKQSELCGPPP